jgi:hypothetical protein
MKMNMSEIAADLISMPQKSGAWREPPTSRLANASRRADQFQLFVRGRGQVRVS